MKCEIEFGATKRETAVAKTTTTTTTKIDNESIWKKCKKTKPNRLLEAKPNPTAEIMSLTEHLQRNPSYKKAQGKPLPPLGNPLNDLTTVKLNRKRCPKTSGRTCVESMLCKVHPEHYIPSLTQPTNNAPDLYDFKRLGVLCWFEVEQSRMVVCWADLICWSGVAVVVWSDGLILVVWSENGLVWELVHGLIGGQIWDSSDSLVWWSDLGRSLWAAVVVWFHGLIREVWLRKIVWSDGWKLKRWKAEVIVVKRL